MEQRTCNIIMCCKGHCNLDGADNTPMGDIAAHMSHECACPKEDYKGWLMERIITVFQLSRVRNDNGLYQWLYG